MTHGSSTAHSRRCSTGGDRSVRAEPNAFSARVGWHQQHTGAAHGEPFSALVIERRDDDARSAASRHKDALGVTRTHVPSMIARREPRTEGKRDGAAHRSPARPKWTNERTEHGDEDGQDCKRHARRAWDGYRHDAPDGEQRDKGV